MLESKWPWPFGLISKLRFIDYNHPQEPDGIVGFKKYIGEVGVKQVSTFPKRSSLALKVVKHIEAARKNGKLPPILFLKCEVRFKQELEECLTAGEIASIELEPPETLASFFASYLHNLGECLCLPDFELVCFEMDRFFRLLAQFSDREEVLRSNQTRSQAILEEHQGNCSKVDHSIGLSQQT